MSTPAAPRLARPRVKPEHAAYRTVDGNVRIGGVVYGIGSEIADPLGWVWSLVCALDGSRSEPEAVADVCRAHPDVGEDAVRAALGQLVSAGYVDDAAACPDGFSAREQERYGRSVAFYRWSDLSARASAWEVQRQLRQARVVVLGVGGTGGSAAHALAASGVGSLHLVDGDVVELSNLNRQVLYEEGDIGRPKVAAAAGRLRAVNRDIEVTAERRTVSGSAEIAALVAGFDVLALAADQPRDIRRAANSACLATGTPWATAGYHGPAVRAQAFRPGDGACWECRHTSAYAEADLRLAPGQDPELASAHLSHNPVNAVSAGMSGMLLAHAVLALLTGVPALPSGSGFGVNLALPSDTVWDHGPRLADCPACGDGAR
ncbi:HesA/MoeB/ThiF family protein [Streptomyces sp. NRRL F-5126]|uniref:HesA/MoeB/ThiF family protein n=1 Tax=Streptomyces sp. NRRL F-5126 TaxID=1463857 RepID=UPI0004C5B545|nr:ThiF family adenylyltransferase [Streptomyces sp. NRRL F-5126]